MKVLIVDDEAHVRSSIRMLIDWEALGIDKVLEAEDGTDAVDLIKRHQPQLVITDIRMPYKNGIELMEWMNANAPHCNKIVVSGHYEYEYVRHTVNLGGTDYLLKPIVKKQLQQAIQRAVDNWKAKGIPNAALKESASNEAQPVYRDNILSNLIKEPLDSWTEMQLLAEQFTRLADIRSCRIAIIQFDALAGAAGEGGDPDAAESEPGQALILLCNKKLKSLQAGAAFRNTNAAGEVVILMWAELSQATRMLSEIERQIPATASAANYEIGLSSVVPFPQKLHSAYKEARKALDHRNLLDGFAHLHEYNESAAGTPVNASFAEDAAGPITAALQSGKSDELLRAVQAWMDRVSAMQRITLLQLTKWLEEYGQWREKWTSGFEDALKLPLGRPMDFPGDEAGRFSLEVYEREMTDDLLQIMRSRQGLRTTHSMEEIAKYIRSHYDQNITLQSISARFFLNREYISRKFKQDVGENVIDYLNRIRIAKAKSLLKSPNLKISDIAYSIGYQDEKYFSRVFKRSEGLTPKEYRLRSNSRP